MANVGRLGNGGMISVGSLIKKIGDMVSVGGKVMLLLSSGMIPIAMDKQFGQGASNCRTRLRPFTEAF